MMMMMMMIQHFCLFNLKKYCPNEMLSRFVFPLCPTHDRRMCDGCGHCKPIAFFRPDVLTSALIRSLFTTKSFVRLAVVSALKKKSNKCLFWVSTTTKSTRTLVYAKLAWFILVEFKQKNKKKIFVRMHASKCICSHFVSSPIASSCKSIIGHSLHCTILQPFRIIFFLSSSFVLFCPSVDRCSPKFRLKSIFAIQ